MSESDCHNDLADQRSSAEGANGHLCNIVVVGASLAGVKACESLRRHGYGGRLTLLGDEAHRPYDRPPLSKQLLLGTFEPEQLQFRRKKGYEDLNLELRLGVRVESLVPDRDLLRLQDGSTLEFDGLVIATGARLRKLTCPVPQSGVFGLRTLDDALALRTALLDRDSRFGGQPRVAVVGAGFIGLEVASVCRALGRDVTVIEQAAIPLARIVGDGMGQAITDMHLSEGVKFRTGVAVQGLSGHSQVTGVALSDGSEVPADIVVVGVGVQPNIEWLSGSGVQVGDGVLCDDRCATSRERVVACGDVARFYNGRFGLEQRVEHWTHAVEMAGAATARLLNGPKVPPFMPVPYFWSDQYDVKLQFAGRAFEDGESWLHEGALENSVEDGGAKRKATVLYSRKGELTGVLAWSNPARFIRFRRAITDGMSVEDARAL